MAQFDVYKNPRGGAYPLLMDAQADVLVRLATRVVVPLMTLKRYDSKPISRLNPVATIGKIEYVLVYQQLAAIPSASLGERVASLATRRTELIDAIEILFTGM